MTHRMNNRGFVGYFPFMSVQHNEQQLAALYQEPSMRHWVTLVRVGVPFRRYSSLRMTTVPSSRRAPVLFSLARHHFR